MEDRESPVSDTPPPPPPPPANSEVPFVSAVNDGFSVGGETGGDLAVKKRRGRPRKYEPDGSLRVVQYQSPTSAEAVFSSGKRGRGRGRGRSGGSGSWKMLGSLGELFPNTAGGNFTPHVVTVYAGEDVTAKVISFSQKGSQGVCVLSANGAVSNVTIRQPCSAGGLLTYEGRFEILSLSGSFTLSEVGGMRSRSGGLSISLASPDGRVIGGGVAGQLMAASPIQMVVGSFTPGGFVGTLKRKQYEPRTNPHTLGNSEAVIPAMPISQAAPKIYSVPASELLVQPHVEAHIPTTTSDKQDPNISSDSGEWNGSDLNSAQRLYPDINVSLLVD